jgi:hypothetical protein
MNHSRSVAAVALAALCSVACGSSASEAQGAGDLAGAWIVPGAEHGHVLEFDKASDRFLLHGPGPGGHSAHDHFEGRFTKDGDHFVLEGTWEHSGNKETARGKRVGDELHVTVGGEALRLQRRS